MLGLGVLAVAGSGATQAQQVYRMVSPDGTITFSDRAPTANIPTTTRTVGGQEPTDAGLPYGLRSIVGRFPVTLYTGPDCTPCASARVLLVHRGVPFTERTVSNNEDMDALRRVSGSSSLPFGTIGRQPLHGFSHTEWTEYLDAAGYPKQSQLPAQYRHSPPSPLAGVKLPPEPATAPQNQRPAAAPLRPEVPSALPGPSLSNPTGIKF